mmetsp:Transcript_17100/g.37690  ORF Transcript_17100/g.37690 Transcript_17100/m.37690 type:complete len:344 (+) Transcript_17100:66-1097(+)
MVKTTTTVYLPKETKNPLKDPGRRRHGLAHTGLPALRQRFAGTLEPTLHAGSPLRLRRGLRPLPGALRLDQQLLEQRHALPSHGVLVDCGHVRRGPRPGAAPVPKHLGVGVVTGGVNGCELGGVRTTTLEQLVHVGLTHPSSRDGFTLFRWALRNMPLVAQAGCGLGRRQGDAVELAAVLTHPFGEGILKIGKLLATVFAGVGGHTVTHRVVLLPPGKQTVNKSSMKIEQRVHHSVLHTGHITPDHTTVQGSVQAIQEPVDLVVPGVALEHTHDRREAVQAAGTGSAVDTGGAALAARVRPPTGDTISEAVVCGLHDGETKIPGFFALLGVWDAPVGTVLIVC